jgi:hypothetical protein
MGQVKTGRLIAVATVAAGAIAAYMMYRRGESLFGIARKTLFNPVGSLAVEVGNAITDKA